jgi:hypothetical protein
MLSESIFQSSLNLAEDLILKVVQNISYELDSVNKRKWDHIIVNQFLRDLREAKKRGNSERRHKEALAILAATAPSIAPTSRNATVRKDAENKVTSARQEVSTVLSLIDLCHDFFIEFSLFPEHGQSQCWILKNYPTIFIATSKGFIIF